MSPQKFVGQSKAAEMLVDPDFNNAIVMHSDFAGAEKMCWGVERALANRFGTLNAEGKPAFTYGYHSSTLELVDARRRKKQTTTPTEMFGTITPHDLTAEAEYVLPLLYGGKAIIANVEYGVRNAKLRGGGTMQKLGRLIRSATIAKNPFFEIPEEPTEQVRITSESIFVGAMRTGRRNAHRIF